MDGPVQQRAAVLTDGGSGLLGRATEVRSIDELIAAVRDGRSAALVVQGEPGIGKTRLLRYASGAAEDLHTLDVGGAESERQMGYAALHRLLLPHLDRLARLPVPQRAALSGAFGLAGGPAPDRFLVALGALTLLADVAAERPLLCIVDDAHWLDAESLETLAFVGRRLHVDGIGLLIGLRHEGTADTTALRGLPTLSLAGLAPAESRALLARAVTGRLDSQVADRITADTGGNPLAVLALAEELSGEQLAGHAELPVPLPVDAQVDRWFLTRVSALPPASQLLLLVAALAPPDDPPTLWRAAAQLGLAPVDADPAVVQGILLVGPEITFRHPLMRSAVHAAARVEDRRRAHAALALASPRDAVPERRAWHLAHRTHVRHRIDRCLVSPRRHMSTTETAATGTSTPMLGPITHVALTVRDIDASIPWYTALIGSAPVLDEDTGPFRHAVFAIGGTLLGLHSFPEGIDDEPFSPRRRGLDHVAFGCADRDELGAWARRLTEMGVVHGEIVDAHYGSAVSFKDPDGLPLEVFCPPGS